LNGKITIRKIVFIAVWLCIAGGMLTLLLAAISNKNQGICKDLSITLKGAQNNFFIDKKDVELLLMKETGGTIKGELISSFKLHDLELALEKNTWISDAELYFDNRNVLHITITEKEPVARIFTTGGNSFYIDSAGRKMPLSDKLSARVPVFTGFSDAKKLNAADSTLLNNVREMANYIISDSFWMAQVAQVDITPERNLEMIPVIGNHLVRFGNADNINKKFRRLFIFYKQVLSKTGFDKYKLVDVQYDGQVVASKYAGNAKVDSVKLKTNIAKLMRQSAESDTAIQNIKPIVKLEADSAIAEDASLKDNAQVNPEQSNPNTMKLSVPEKSNATNRTSSPKPTAPKSSTPRAVMPKRNTESNTDSRGYN
jgi:cell division protein FtsQ